MSNRGGRLRFGSVAAAATALLLVACTGPVDENDTHYSELESVWQYLEAYSIYQDSSIYKNRIPADPFVYSDPAEMMRAVGDTLYGAPYTVYGISSLFSRTTTEGKGVEAGKSGISSSLGTLQQAQSSRRQSVFLDTLTDSTVLITIEGFKNGEIENGVQWDHTYETFIDKLPGVHPFPIVVVDIRGNGGGDIDETKLIVDAFIPSGKAFIQAREREYNDEKRTARTINWHPWKTKDLARLELSGKRLTVLMDQGSASASEILIAALKDCAGATLVGDRSFGKGIGQIKIFRRDRPGLQITYLQMQGVSERIGDYHHRGIEPDVPASGSEEEVLLAAVKMHEPSATRLRRLRKEAVSPTPIGAYRVVWE